MPKCLFDRATGLFAGGVLAGALAVNPVTQVLLVLAAYPDKRTQRWDGATDVRPATPAEVAAFDASEADAEARGAFDNTKAIKAVALYYRTQINEVRAALLLPPLTVADVRQGIIDAYKALP